MPIPVITSEFDGGISNNTKTGLLNACRFSRGLSIFDDSDSVTLNPKPIQDSTTSGLVKVMVDSYPYATDRYGYDSGGNIYKIASNVWSTDRSGATIGNGATGQGMLIMNDSLLYATSTTIGIKRYLSLTPTYNDDLFTDGTQNIDLSQSLSGQTYTTPTSITESAANLISIVPTRDPLKTVNITLTGAGTGNVTVTIHDSNNNSIGTATIAHASVTTGSNAFTFSTPLRINIGRTYHIHVTSTVADTTVTTGTTANLSTATFSTVFGILIADTEYHPMIQHTDGTKGIVVIGNENYMATWDFITYNPNKIQIKPGFRIRGFARENEFIVAYATKGTNIDSFEEGELFYWNGIQSYYNYSKPVPDGTPNALIASKNRMFSVIGSNGALTLGTEPFKKIQPAPKLTKGYKVEVLPGAITNWQGRVHFGYSNTTDTSAGSYNSSTGVPPTGIEQGVYEYGNQSDRAISYTSVSDECLNFAYSPSTAIANPLSFQIGCVWGVGKDLYVSYKDGSSYYVDRINKTNGAQTFGSFETLIHDKGILGQQLASMPQKTKNAIKLVITFAALPTGCTLKPKYRADRAANWTYGSVTAQPGDSLVELSFGGITDLRYRELEYGFDVYSTSANYPYITGMCYLFDPLANEVAEN